MSQVEITTGNLDTPYVSFPENSERIELDGFPVQKYISPREMSKYISELSEKTNLHGFDAILVNNRGGWFLFKALARLQNYNNRPIEIEYHRSPAGYSSIINRGVPADLKSTKNLIIEDVYDTAGTLKAIFDDAPNSAAIVAVKKIGVPNQIQLNNVLVGVEVDNHWLGGVGMNFGPDYPSSFPRNYPGLVVKPQQ